MKNTIFIQRKTKAQETVKPKLWVRATEHGLK